MVTVDTWCSPTLSVQLLLGLNSKTSRPCFCVNVAAHVLISHACMFYMCFCVCCSLLLDCHRSICYLPKPEAPVSFWGVSGRKKTNWAITVLLLSRQSFPSPPCLVFLLWGLYCEGLFLCFSLSCSLLAYDVTSQLDRCFFFLTSSFVMFFSVASWKCSHLVL